MEKRWKRHRKVFSLDSDEPDPKFSIAKKPSDPVTHWLEQKPEQIDLV